MQKNFLKVRYKLENKTITYFSNADYSFISDKIGILKVK